MLHFLAHKPADFAGGNTGIRDPRPGQDDNMNVRVNFSTHTHTQSPQKEKEKNW